MYTQVLKLIIESSLFIVVTIALFKLCKKNNNGSTLFPIKVQLVIGVIYGIFACAFSLLGFDIGGAIQNIRDAAPLSAGIYFGPVAGIVAGSIGALHRFLLFAQPVTRIACTVGTFLAGLIGALIKKYILQEKIPSWIYAFTIGIVAEVTHLLMVFVFRTIDVGTTIVILYTCAKLMVPMVAIVTTLPTIYLHLEYKIKHPDAQKPKRTIADDIQAGLFISVLVAYIITNAFVVVTQNDLAFTTASNAMNKTLEDAANDVKNANFDDLTDEQREQYIIDDIANWHIGSTGWLTVFKEDGTLIASSDYYVNTNQDNIIDYIPNIFEIEENKVEKLSFEDEDNYYSYRKLYEGYYIIAIYPSDEANLNRNFSIILTGFLEIIILAILFFQIFVLIKIIVVDRIGKINDGLAKISSGNLDTVVDVRNNSEFDTLSDDINATVDTLKVYIEEAKHRMDSELKFASEIQSSALPKTFPISRHFDLYADMIAAKHVGGDFYDFYRVDNDRIAFCIADVSGKGIPAALFMMKAKTLLKGLVESGCTPGETFTKANNELCLNNALELFVTAWLGILNLKTGVLTYSNAGHNPPIIGRKNASADFLKQLPGFVLGGLNDIHYKDFELKLEEEEGIFLYTDGVTEATNSSNEQYGEERLIKVLNEVTAVNMRYLIKVVKDDVDKFAGDAPQFDDITMIGIRLISTNEKDAYIELDPKQESSQNILNEFIDKFVEDNNISIKSSSKMLIIVDEIYSNILQYSRATKARLRLLIRNGLISLAFSDNGLEYDPLSKEDPDITLSAEEREIGGLGIYMTKKMSEDIKYTRQGGFNILDVVIKNEE